MNFQSDENVLREERIHPGIFILPVVTLFLGLIPGLGIYYFLSVIGQASNHDFFRLALLALIAPLLPGLGALGAVWLAYLKSEVTLTNKRLIFRTGLVARVSGELPLENIDAIYLSESVLGRLLGFGAVVATSVGGAEFPFRFIGKPQEFHALLQQAVAAAKRSSNATPKLPPVDDDARFMPKG